MAFSNRGTPQGSERHTIVAIPNKLRPQILHPPPKISQPADALLYKFEIALHHGPPLEPSRLLQSTLACLEDTQLLLHPLKETLPDGLLRELLGELKSFREELFLQSATEGGRSASERKGLLDRLLERRQRR